MRKTDRIALGAFMALVLILLWHIAAVLHSVNDRLEVWEWCEDDENGCDEGVWEVRYDA